MASTRIAAYGVVLRLDQILVCRISTRVSEWAGRWTLPGGGIEFGEDPAEAMVREVREETGLLVRATGVAGIDSLVVPDGGVAKHSLRIIYFAEVLGGSLTNEVDGSTDLLRVARCSHGRVTPDRGSGENRASSPAVPPLASFRS